MSLFEQVFTIHYLNNVYCFSLSLSQFEERCEVNTSSLLLCRSPAVSSEILEAEVQVEFLLDNLRFDFNSVTQSSFTYKPNPILQALNLPSRQPTEPYRYKPGSVIMVEVSGLYFFLDYVHFCYELEPFIALNFSPPFLL